MSSRRISHRARANGLSRRNPVALEENYGLFGGEGFLGINWTRTQKYAHAKSKEAKWYSRWQRCVGKHMTKKGGAVVPAGPESMGLDPSSKKCDYRWHRWQHWVGKTGSAAAALKAKREQQMKDTEWSSRRYSAEEEKAEETLMLQSMSEAEAKRYKRKKKEKKARKLAKQGYLTEDDLLQAGDEALAEMEEDMTMTYVALGGGVLLLGGLAWFLLAKDED